MSLGTFLAAVFTSRHVAVASDPIRPLVKSAMFANQLAGDQLARSVRELVAENLLLRTEAEPCDIPECRKRPRVRGTA